MNRKTAERIISTLKAYGDPRGWDTQTLVDAILAAAQEEPRPILDHDCPGNYADMQTGKPYPCPHKQEPQAIPQAEIDALPVGRAYGGTEPKSQASEPIDCGDGTEWEEDLEGVSSPIASEQATAECPRCKKQMKKGTYHTCKAIAEPTCECEVGEYNPHNPKVCFNCLKPIRVTEGGGE